MFLIWYVICERGVAILLLIVIQYEKYEKCVLFAAIAMTTCEKMKMWGSVTVWPKGQIVIPKEIRDLVGIQPGDTLIALSKWDKWVGFIKNEDFFSMIQYMKDEIENIEGAVQNIV